MPARRRIRKRDLHAIAFCLVVCAGVFGATLVIFNSWPRAIGSAAIGSAALLMHPRMVRVRRRLSGLSSCPWEGYYRE